MLVACWGAHHPDSLVLWWTYCPFRCLLLNRAVSIWCYNGRNLVKKTSKIFNMESGQSQRKYQLTCFKGHSWILTSRTTVNSFPYQESGNHHPASTHELTSRDRHKVLRAPTCMIQLSLCLFSSELIGFPLKTLAVVILKLLGSRNSKCPLQTYLWLVGNWVDSSPTSFLTAHCLVICRAWQVSWFLDPNFKA